MRVRCLLVLSMLTAGLSAACGDDGGPAGPDGSTVTFDAQPGTALAFVSPVATGSLLGSAVVDLDASADIIGAEVFVVGEAAPRCAFTARPFLCLVDLSTVPSGAFTLSARGLDAGGAELATATIALDHRAPPADPCPDAMAPSDCIAALVAAGAAAGYTGLSYHCMDDGHATADTSAMPGIEVQINQSFAGSDPWHTDPARIVVANQSQAYNYPDGWESIPRAASIAMIGMLWEQSKLFLWPEHRDHGFVDYYSWQTSTLILSQGSSGTELDEVGKLLNLLAAFRSDVRGALHDAQALMSAVSMIHRRARLATDLDYLTAAAHPPAFQDADTARAGIRLANAVLPDELPPVARLTVEQATIPADWAALPFAAQEMSPYTLTFAPYALPASAPAGTFVAIIDLAASSDVNARPLYYFASVVRGDPARLRVTRLSATRFQVEAEWPADHAEMVNGQQRTTRRATVAFFAHNGLWLSAPAFLSVFGGNPHEHAPDSNDLD